MIVHFVDIGEMVDHHCLSFPFIRHQFGIKLYFITNSIAYESDRNIRFTTISKSNKNFNVICSVNQGY